MNKKSRKILNIEAYSLLSFFIFISLASIIQTILIILEKNNFLVVNPTITVASLSFVAFILILFFSIFLYIDSSIVPKLRKWRKINLMLFTLYAIIYAVFIITILIAWSNNWNFSEKISLLYHCVMFLLMCLLITFLVLEIRKIF
ncbi:hypothetical protein ACJA25_00760 [Mycoplasmopsis hyopharyngis]|uniref:hypothetical protein n=1 Tax=Mycoplasmopsis hyopharyngis TaxID=29558 RepID=UPI003872CC4A